MSRPLSLHLRSVFVLVVVLLAGSVLAQEFSIHAIQKTNLPSIVGTEDTNYTFSISNYFTSFELNSMNYSMLAPPTNTSIRFLSGWQDRLTVAGSVQALFGVGSTLYIAHGKNVSSYDGSTATLRLATNITGAMNDFASYGASVVAVGDQGSIWFINASGAFNVSNTTLISNRIRYAETHSDNLYIVLENGTLYFFNDTTGESRYYSPVPNAELCLNASGMSSDGTSLYLACGRTLVRIDGAIPSSSVTNVTVFPTNITSLFIEGSMQYMAIANNSVFDRSGASPLNKGAARGTVSSIARLNSRTYYGESALVEYDNTTRIRPVESTSTVVSGAVMLAVVDSTLYAGSSSGEIDSFTGNHSTAMILTPDGNFTTTGISALSFIVNASDNVGSSALSNQVTLEWTAVNDPPVYNGTSIPSVLLVEDTNYTLNISAYFTDVEDFEPNMTYVPSSPPQYFNISYNRSNGIMTFVPHPYSNEPEIFTINATDSGGLTAQSSQIIFSITAVPNDNIVLQTINNITVAQASSATLNLTQYYFDPDGDTRYGYVALENATEWNISVTPVTGMVFIAPVRSFAGTALINFTFTDLWGAVNRSEVVIVYVTAVPTGPQYNDSNALSNVTLQEDANLAPYNLRLSFSDQTGDIIGFTARDRDYIAGCSFDTFVCTNLTFINQTNVSIVSGLLSSGISLSNASVVGLNMSGVLTNQSGTIEFWINTPLGQESLVDQIILDTRNTTGQDGVFLYRNSTSSLVLMFRGATANASGSDVISYLVSNDTWGANRSRHVAITYASWNDGLTASLYLDGVKVANQSRVPAMRSMGQRLYLGSNQTRGTNLTNETLLFDELRLWNTSLNATQIENNHFFAYPFITVAITNATGNVSLTPVANWSGVAFYTFTAIENVTLFATSPAVSITVAGTNDAPYRLQNAPSISLLEDIDAIDIMDFDDYVRDLDNLSLLYTPAENSYVALSVNASSHRLSISPSANYYGNQTVNVTVSDGNYSFDVPLSITVVDQSDTFAMVVVTPSQPQNGTVPIYFMTSTVDDGAVNVTVQYSLDGGITWINATGPKLAGLSSINSTSRITAHSDAMILSSSVNQTYGSNTTFLVGSSGADVYRTFLQFAIPPAIPSMVQRATVNLFQRASQGEAREIGVFAINQSFDENNVSWSNAPGNTSFAGSVLVDSIESYITIDATSLVRSWTNQSTNNGLMLKDLSEGAALGLHSFASSEYGGNITPFIEIFYNATQHVFYWDTIEDIYYANDDDVVVRIFVDGTNNTGSTYNFTVRNNNAPNVTTAAANYSLLEDTNLTIYLSSLFQDIDADQTLTYTFVNLTNLSVINDYDEIETEVVMANGSSFQGSPSAIGVAGSETLLTFMDYSGGQSDIRVSRYDADGLFIYVTNITNDTVTQTQPSAAVLDTTQSAIVYTESPVGDLGNIKLAIVDSSSNDEVQYRVNISIHTAEQRSPAVIAQGTRTRVFWEDARNGPWQIYFSELNTTFGSIISERNITGQDANSTNVVPVALSANETLVIWTSNNKQLIAEIVNSSGLVMNRTNITGVLGSQGTTSAVLDSTGFVHVVYAANLSAANTTQLYYVRLNRTVVDATSVLTSGNSPSLDPVIGIDGSDRLTVVYQSGITTDANIFLMNLNRTGSVIYTKTVTNASGEQGSPALAVASNGNKMAFWQSLAQNDDLNGLFISTQESRFIIVPTGNFSGNVTAIVNMSDSYDQASRTLTFQVQAVNDVPQFVGPVLVNLLEDNTNTSINLSQWFADVDNVSMLYSVTTGTNVSAAVSNSTLNISATAANYSGLTSILVSASDGSATTTANVTINITSVNDVPVYAGSIAAQTWLVNTNATVNLTGIFTDVDNTTLIYNGSTLGNVSVMINQTSLIMTLVPDQDWYGTTTLMVNASDGMNKTNSSRITLTVQLPSIIFDSSIDGSTYNGTYTNLTGFLNATVTNSTLTNVTANHSIIVNSTILHTSIWLANISDGILYSGLVLMTNGTIYNASDRGMRNLTGLINYAPTAVINVSNSTGNTSTLFVFDSVRSNDTNIGQMLADFLNYTWYFGDGTNSTNQTPFKVYAADGTYTLTLNVTDQFGRYSTATTTITVGEVAAPVVDAGSGSGGGGGGGSSGGGGSGGGVVLSGTAKKSNEGIPITGVACTEQWTCTPWSSCIDGSQFRTCTDVNACMTYDTQPLEYQECTAMVSSSDEHCWNGYWDADETGVDCGGVCGSCPDEEQPSITGALLAPIVELFPALEYYVKGLDWYAGPYIEPYANQIQGFLDTARTFAPLAGMGLIGGLFLASMTLALLHRRKVHLHQTKAQQLMGTILERRALGIADKDTFHQLHLEGNPKHAITVAMDLANDHPARTYIETTLGMGYTAAQVEEMLVQNGWEKERVRRILRDVEKSKKKAHA